MHNRIEEYIAERCCIVYGTDAVLVCDEVLCESFSCVENVLNEKSLDIGNIHILTELVNEGYVSGKIFASFNKGGVEGGLKLDLLYDVFECGFEVIFCFIICVNIILIKFGVYLCYRTIRGYRNGIADICGFILTPELLDSICLCVICGSVPRRIKNALGDRVAANSESESVEQTSAIRINYLFFCICNGELGYKTESRGSFITFTEFGTARIGKIGCTVSRSTVGHKNNNGNSGKCAESGIGNSSIVCLRGEKIDSSHKTALDICSALNGNACICRSSRGTFYTGIRVYENSLVLIRKEDHIPGFVSVIQILTVGACCISAERKKGGCGSLRIGNNADSVVFTVTEQLCNAGVSSCYHLISERISIYVHRARYVKNQYGVGGGVLHSFNRHIRCDC